MRRTYISLEVLRLNSSLTLFGSLSRELCNQHTSVISLATNGHYVKALGPSLGVLCDTMGLGRLGTSAAILFAAK